MKLESEWYNCLVPAIRVPSHSPVARETEGDGCENW